MWIISIIVIAILVIAFRSIDSTLDNIKSDNNIQSGDNIQKENVKSKQEILDDKNIESLYRHNKQGQTLIYDSYKIIVQTILKHFKTLDIKYKQSVFVDDYGCVKDEAWYKELSYFVDNVLLPILFDKIENINTISILYCSGYDISFNLPQQINLSELDDFNSILDIKFKDINNTTINLTEEYIRDKYEESPLPIPSIDFFSDYCALALNATDDGISTQDSLNEVFTLYHNKYENDFKLDEQALLDMATFLETYNNSNDVKEFKLIMFGDLFNKEILINQVHNLYNQLKEHIIVNTPLTETKNINPYEFENKCALILQEKGFETQVTKGSGDQGVDVLAKKNNFSIAIQCKLYNNPVGNKAVQEIISGQNFYNTDYAVVVSNAPFTISAKKLASKCNVILLNVQELENLDSYLD